MIISNESKSAQSWLTEMRDDQNMGVGDFSELGVATQQPLDLIVVSWLFAS